MSDPRLISPMLDGFALGGSISCHSGVTCYPAMRNDSDERYIVKTISIPASQVQLEALLLTGAYPDAEAAKGYFKELARGIRDEVEILDRLSAQRGFLPYTKYQIAPMEEGVGYEVFLISPYKRSLAQQFKAEPLTHLSAVNMGIDLCAALSVCREAGFLYVDLKPGNIFLDENQEYHIADLGFVDLNSLKYASLPDRYRSDYIPPEVSDAYATLNTTMDTYALGMVLYQVFNNGQLPFDSEEDRNALMNRLANGESLPPPAYADYEMAEIILKACAFHPEDRWSTPNEMGHALIAYMQRNDVNDVPIVPPAVDSPVVDSAENEPEETDSEVLSSEEPPPDEQESAEPDPEEDLGDEETFDDVEIDSDEEVDPEETEDADWIDRMDQILSEDEAADAEASDSNEPSLRELLETDEEAPELSEEELTGETAEILNQAQELIDHEAPEPVVTPVPIDIPIPAPIILEDDEDDEDNADAPSEEADSAEAVSEDTAEETSDKKPKIRAKKIITAILLLIALAAAAYGGYYAYTNYYLVPIDTFSVEGHDDVLVVTVQTDRDSSLLTVVCKDNFGNVIKSKVVNGQASFNALTPGSQYLVNLEVEKYHKLTGEISERTYSTPPRTQIASLAATVGPEDGSAIVSFAVEGPESESWTLHYAAEGEEEKTTAFSGHTVTVTGLTLGKTYTFHLTASDDVFLIGENSIQFYSGQLVFAENIKVFPSDDGTMTATWSAPEETNVDSWTVHCYNDAGYDQTQEVTEPKAVFPETSASVAYTLEITAKGMSESKVIPITVNPVTVTKANVDSTGTSITVNWEFQGVAPANGWVISYIADKTSQAQTVTSDTTSVTISPVAPGAHYDISIQTADKTSVFGGTTSVETAEITTAFSGYLLDASDFTVTMHQAPESEDWSRSDLGDSITTFAPGSKMALLYYTTSIYNLSSSDLVSMFVIRNEAGNVVSATSNTRTWDEMLDRGYCEEEIAKLPEAAGNYTLEIYVDSMKLSQLNFIIQ